MAASASSKLASPIRAAPSADDLSADISLSSLQLNGTTIGADVIDRVTAADLERSMDEASSLTITLRDTDRAILNSGLLSQPILDAEIDGLFFRLVKVGKSDDDLSLVFEDREVAILRTKTGHKKVSRAKHTRAEFARLLVREVKNPVIRFFSNELHKVQPISSGRASSSESDLNRQPGFAKGIKLNVKGVRASSDQVSNISRVLQVGISRRANHKVLVSSIMTIIQEATAKNLSGGDLDSVGLFQQRNTWGTFKQRHNPEFAAGLYFDRAIPTNKSQPNLSASDLAQSVQRSAFPKAYAQWKAEAEAAVKAFRADDVKSNAVQKQSPYFFMRGAPAGDKSENTWDCLARLGEEVNWRRFMVAGVVYFAAEDFLIKSRPRLIITERTDGVHFINFDIDTGKKIDRATVSCRAARWTAPPGSVVQVEDCGQATGRWLVGSITRSLFSRDASIELRKPAKRLNEPVAEESGGSTGGKKSGNVDGDKRQAIVDAAKDAYAHRARFTYKQSRPMPNTLLPGGDGQIAIDCSTFVTLCYKRARAKNPNGGAYNGQGFTGTLVRHGKKVATPQLGDIAFYGGSAAVPSHCTLFVGNGQIIGMGNHGVIQQSSKVAIGGPFRFFMRYEL